jgi:pyruvate formate lyase activating enzyme
MINGIITDIQRASVHDGPGYRTTVFLKGCPLRCAWCHNPETINPKPETLLYPEKCIGCNMCDKGCFSGARVVCGREVSPEQLFDELVSDIPYYKNGGGVTFSGGEPLMQKEFLKEMIRLCKSKNINVAVETSLMIFDKDILSSVDLIIADLKIWDNALHKKYTGVDNLQIIENFRRADSLGVRMIARTPIIPEIEQDIDKISEFLHSLKNLVRYELLPYHPLGLPKYEALGLDKPQFTIPTDQYMKELKKYVIDLC